MSDLSDDLAGLLDAVREVAAEHAGIAETIRAAGRPEHRAGATCRACPLCQGLEVLRQVRPEVVDHLGVAVDELAQALRSLLTPRDGAPAEGVQPVPAAAPGGAATTVPPRPPVQVERIEIEP